MQLISLIFTFAADRGPVAALVLVLRARVRAPVAAAVAVLAPKDAPYRVPDHALHLKILRSPIRTPIKFK